MRSAAAALLLFHGFAVWAACPQWAPQQMAIGTFCPSEISRSDQACPNGPVSFRLTLSGFGVPGVGSPGSNASQPYPIQPCDSVTWDFGDGTTQTVIADAAVTHTFVAPDNYTIRASVTNSLGSARSPATSHAIATSPSRVSFVTQPIGSIDRGQCSNCLIAGEGSGSVTIDVERSIDLSRTISVLAGIPTGGYDPATSVSPFSIPLTFGPGETRKSLVVPIKDDNVLDCPRAYALHLTDATGGAVIAYPSPTLLITDNDPRPNLSFEPQVFVREGDEGQWVLMIPARLSAEMARTTYLFVSLREATAGLEEDFARRYSNAVAANTTSPMLDAASIKGDKHPERDEQFIIEFAPACNGPSLDIREVLVTIVNDDAGFVPEHLSLTTGNTATLTFDIVAPYSKATTVAFTSSNESAIRKPGPVTIPAGVTRVDIPITAGAAGNAIIRASAPDRTVQPATIVVTNPPRRRSTRH